LSFFIIIIAGLIITKLFLVEIVHGNTYLEKADRQYISSSDAFDRGSIFFENKKGVLISAATLKNGFKIILNTARAGDPEKTYEKISSVIPIDYESFMKKAEKVNDPHEEIATKIDAEDAKKLQNEKIPGLEIEKQKWRVYPGGGLAAQTLGFVGFKGNDYSGRYGAERQWNNILARDEEATEINFFAEVFANIRDTVAGNEEKEGDVVLTIEPGVQAALEELLANLEKNYSTEKVGGIIMNPKTGAIYAMGASPSYDPNDIANVPDPMLFTNPLVENVYEMGSVIKPLVMASALDAKVLTAKTTYYDKGYVDVLDRTIYNFDKKGRGTASMQDVLNQSLNTGMVFVEQKLGKDKMQDYMYGFKINEKTGIDLPGEVTSLTSNLKIKHDVEYANAAFGQGIALTPIATVRAFSALANEGTLVTPHVLGKIVYKGGSEFTPEYEHAPSKISKETSEEITDMLITVFDKALLGGKYSLEHYSIAAKTGTAQVAKDNGGGYYTDKHLHSFFGYFPAYDPKFLIFLFALDPKGVNYAAYSLAEPFSNIAKFLIDYYNVPPDR